MTCESKLNTGQSVMAQLALGNSYSTPPRQFVQFSMAQIDDGVRVQASSWIETQMAFGQINRGATDQTIQQKNGLQGFLFKAGARPVTGSLAAERPMIGVSWVNAPAPGQTKPSIFITDVEPGMPAEASGLKACDRIVSIDGKAVSADAEASEAILAAKGPAIPFEVDRGGETLRFSITPVTKSLSYRASDAENQLDKFKARCAG